MPPRTTTRGQERPTETEVVIALVVAVGTDVQMVTDLLQTELSSYDYSSTVTRVSQYLSEQSRRKPSPYFDKQLWSAMSDGDLLRERWARNDALALHAISDIVAERTARSKGKVEVARKAYEPASLNRHAYIIRSLKTQEELRTLRDVYGPRLYVVAAYSPRERRLAHLADVITDSRKSNDRASWSHSPEELIRRDEREERAAGQDVTGTYHQADFFIRATDRPTAVADVARTMAILFGDPFQTPTRDEQGQFVAAGAAMRSAELGRQVGAAIRTDSGSTVAVGTNEVPFRGGGSVWSEDPEDNRDFFLRRRDTNREHLDDLTAELERAVGRHLRRTLDQLALGRRKDRKRAVKAFRADVGVRLRAAGLKDLTEFGRAVHAEMNALLDAGRRGTSVLGTTMHTTTFPCHNCARHIIGAGISRVVFIEPYPKSRAVALHGDSMTMDRAAEGDRRVAFEPFVGVAPRRYLELFDAAAREAQGHTRRKGKDGTAGKFRRRKAVPVFRDAVSDAVRPALPAYRAKEVLALADFEELDAALEAESLGKGPSAA